MYKKERYDATNITTFFLFANYFNKILSKLIIYLQIE
jgi:hypothetical protein